MRWTWSYILLEFEIAIYGQTPIAALEYIKNGDRRSDKALLAGDFHTPWSSYIDSCFVLFQSRSGQDVFRGAQR